MPLPASAETPHPPVPQLETSGDGVPGDTMRHSIGTSDRPGVPACEALRARQSRDTDELSGKYSAFGSTKGEIQNQLDTDSDGAP